MGLYKLFLTLNIQMANLEVFDWTMLGDQWQPASLITWHFVILGDKAAHSLICNVVTLLFFGFCFYCHSKLTLYTECCSELLDSDTCTWLQALSKILSGYEKKQVCMRHGWSFFVVLKRNKITFALEDLTITFEFKSVEKLLRRLKSAWHGFYM